MKNLQKTALAALALALLSVGAVFASGQHQTTTSPKTASVPAIHVLINSSPWLDSYKALVAAYEKATGNQVTLDVTPFPGMLQKSRNAVTAPTSEYDLINLNESWYLEFYKGGLVTPINQIDPSFKLSPQVIEYQYADRWDPKANGSTKNGEIYGLPINGNIQILYYRKDLFAQKGLTPPTTFAQLLADTKALADPPKMYGFLTRTSDDPDFNLLAFIHGFGGSIVSYHSSSGKWSVNVDKKPALDALKFWLNMAWTYDPPNYTEISQASMISLMASGHAAMAIMVDAAASNFNDPNVSSVIGKIGAVVVPGETAALRSPTSGIWVMAIPHNLPMDRKKAALEFLTWQMSKEAQTISAEAGGIPVRQDVYQALANNPKFWWAQAVADSTPYIKPFPRVTGAGQIDTYFDDLLRQVVAKQIAPDVAMKQAAQKIQSIMVSTGYPMEPLAN